MPLTRCHIFLRASFYQQGAFLVSDALSPLGLVDGIYPWDSRKIEVINGTARLADGTLSGTTLSLFAGVQNLLRWGLFKETIADLIALATEAPRKAIGLPGIGVGSSLNNLLRWSFDVEKQDLTWERMKYGR
jgi:N-acetylglucosamine-6-phosphate deacetylase